MIVLATGTIVRAIVIENYSTPSGQSDLRIRLMWLITDGILRALSGALKILFHRLLWIILAFVNLCFIIFTSTSSGLRCWATGVRALFH